MKRGWWTDDDGFLRSPDNVTAYALDDCVKLLDDKDEQLAEAVGLLRDLFANCAIIHKHWGDGSNQKEAYAAIANAEAFLSKVGK